MTLQNKLLKNHCDKSAFTRSINMIIKTYGTLLPKSSVCAFFVLGLSIISVNLLSDTAYAQPVASDIDWISLEDLDPAMQAEIMASCCGLYIEPDLPQRQGMPENIELSADSAIDFVNSDDESTVTLEGNVEILQLDQLIQADSGLYNRNTEIINLDGNIKIRQPGMLLVGSDALVDRNQESSQLNNASYVLHQEGIRGTAEIIVYTDADGIITIDNGLYTRCEPGDNSWTISSKAITLDQAAGRGVARNVTLKIKDIPIFYSPYMSFPINDQRSSGFLAPTIGSTRDGGFDFSIPYYFNLAPNYDATVTPRLLTDRGVMLNIEGRYLGAKSNNILNMAFLPDDKLYDQVSANIPGSDSPPQEDRWLVDYNYRGRLGSNWNASINFAEVSDEDYFRDLGDIGLDNITFSYLTRDAQINYQGANWRFNTSAQSYQVIDPTISQLSLPYDSLPKISLSGQFDNNAGLQYGIESEYVYFDRDINRDFVSQNQINQGALASGKRLTLEPSISWPWASSSAFVTPTAKYKYASYQLEDQAQNTSDQQSRGIFMASVDSGLIFERDIEFRLNNYTQTLEPRLYYLYSEYEDQNDIPVFDSANMTFSFSQLFREDRFSGKDRIGDSNQLTLALSSQFLDERGQQKANISIGQILYFSDRKVSLNRVIAPISSQSDSAIASEFSYQFNTNWRVKGYLEWDSHNNSVDVGNFQFRYQSDVDHVLNFSHRIRENQGINVYNGLDSSINQTDVSGIWPLSGNWGLIGRWNYDHANDRILEGIIGVEYDTCCWNVRMVAREWVDQDDLFQVDVENDTGVFLQFELKGLGSVLGGNVSSILSNGISGYREHEYVR